MELKFSDGMTFDTSGKLRPVKKSDGWYVVGEGMLCAVNDLDEAMRLIEKLEKKEK